MLTYFKTIMTDGRQLDAYEVLSAGYPNRGGLYAVPAGRFDVYRQGGHFVLVRAGRDPHDYDGTYFYVRSLAGLEREPVAA